METVENCAYLACSELRKTAFQLERTKSGSASQQYKKAPFAVPLPDKVIYEPGYGCLDLVPRFALRVRVFPSILVHLTPGSTGLFSPDRNIHKG